MKRRVVRCYLKGGSEEDSLGGPQNPADARWLSKSKNNNFEV
jgi:hypothetical protein